MSPLGYLALFAVSSVLGYLILRKVPSLLHTPLMSGMNALSGVTLLGALSATALSLAVGNRAMGFLALCLAMLNLSGGLGVTVRMLRLFRKKRGRRK